MQWWVLVRFARGGGQSACASHDRAAPLWSPTTASVGARCVGSRGASDLRVSVIKEAASVAKTPRF
jgi:hypothetical protein